MNRWRDLAPVLLVAALALLALPLIGSGTTWLTLSIAGIAMGLMIFVISHTRRFASGVS